MSRRDDTLLDISRLILFLVIIIALVSPRFPVRAAVTFNVQIGTTAKMQVPNYSSYVNFSSSLFATKVFVLAKYANFSNAALSSTSNPTQTFGVASSTSAATVMVKDIQSDHTELKEYFASGNPLLYFSYVMPAGVSYTYPQNVLIKYGTVTQTLSYPYLTGASDLTSCSAPCAYLNQSNSTMIIKGLNGPDTIDVYYSPAPLSVQTTQAVTSQPTTPPISPSAITPSSIGSAISSAGNAISSAVSNVAINLPIVTPAAVGNPSFNALAEVATAVVIVLIFAIGFLGRRGKTISSKASQPKMTPTPNKAASTKIKPNNNKKWHPKITFLGNQGQPRIKPSSPRSPRPKPMQQAKSPKFEPMHSRAFRPFNLKKKRDYELP